LDSLKQEIAKVIIGQEEAIEQCLIVLLTGAHALIEGTPGVAKTLLTRTMAQALGGEFARIQFTPDLMPSDVTGSSIYDQRAGVFQFRPGPVFTNLLLADEINRTPPKTQAALLEAMQERQVTAEGTTRPLARPFLVIATQNPIEYEGTYPLPEAQLDRFLLRARVGYPARDDELRMLARRAERGIDEVTLSQVVDARGVVELQTAPERVHMAESVGYYIVDVVAATRSDKNLEVGASPRGALALFKLARAKAVLAGRDYLIPDDVKAVAVPALAHRLTLRPELWVRRVNPDEVVREILARVPTPAAEDLAGRRA